MSSYYKKLERNKEILSHLDRVLLTLYIYIYNNLHNILQKIQYVKLFPMHVFNYLKYYLVYIKEFYV